MPEVLALIPARSGSKSIPHKNIKPLRGKPLIAYTIEQSLGCKLINRTIVSTDSKEYAEIAQQQGAEVPFLRPAQFASDNTADFPVFKHALDYLKSTEDYCPDIVVWLRPTAPLRSVGDINNAINIALEDGPDCVRSVCMAEHHPYWMKTIEGDRLIPFIIGKDEKQYYRRQLLPPVYRINGVVDVYLTRSVIKKKSLYNGHVKGYVMPVERSIDIDTEIDFIYASILMERKLDDVKTY